jgi:hypothetical protein
MREQLNTIAVPGLRLALGLVVLLESVHFTLSAAAAHHCANRFAAVDTSGWMD